MRSHVKIPTFTKVRDHKGKLLGYQGWYGLEKLDMVRTWKEARAYSKRLVAAQLPYTGLPAAVQPQQTTTKVICPVCRRLVKPGAYGLLSRHGFKRGYAQNSLGCPGWKTRLSEVQS